MANLDDMYFDFSKEDKDHAMRYLLDVVIRSRERCGCPSNQPVYDEDVNVYLANLLFAVSTSEYQKMAHKYVKIHRIDLSAMIDQADENYMKYFVYKINADYLLIYLTVFEDYLRTVMKNTRVCHYTESGFASMARSYYDQAAVFNQRIYHKRTAVSDILDKVGKNFDVYCLILRAARKDYFHFMNEYQDDHFAEFTRRVEGYEKEHEIKKRQDIFLDLYGQWLENPANTVLRKEVEEACLRVRDLDPDFNFKLD